MSKARRIQRALVVVSNLALAVLASASASALDPVWEQGSRRSPPALPNAPVVYDAARDKVVLFGGLAWWGTSDETWEWDGQTWAFREPAHHPTARGSHALAYDAGRGRVVLFGGGDNAWLNETWEWDGTDWTQMMPAHTPSARAHPLLVYNAAVGRTVLFGDASDDTWEWDGLDWTSGTGSHPTPSGDAVGAYVPGSGAVVWQSERQELWKRPASWENITTRLEICNTNPSSSCCTFCFPPPASMPSCGGRICSSDPWPDPIAEPGFAYDSGRNRLVLFGGHHPGAMATINYLWEWDGQHWTSVAPATTPGHRTARSKLVYDSARARLLVFGGQEMGTPTSWSYEDVWQWNGSAWTQVAPAPGPQGVLYGYATAYDPVAHKTLVFTGTETWHWDGQLWTKLSPATSPKPRRGHALAFDRTRGRMVMFGGCISDICSDPGDAATWEWDGATWLERASAHAPTIRTGMALAFDPVRQRTVLFVESETWEWDGTDWSQKTPLTSPAARRNASMVYDEQRGAVALFGGFDTGPLNDLWTWNGTEWHQVSPSLGLPPRQSAGLAYHSLRHSIIVFGGSGYNDTWEITGNQLTLWPNVAPPKLTPFGGDAQTMTYDEARDRIVFFGARGSTDVWELRFSGCQTSADCDGGTCTNGACSSTPDGGFDGGTDVALDVTAPDGAIDAPSDTTSNFDTSRDSSDDPTSIADTGSDRSPTSDAIADIFVGDSAADAGPGSADVTTDRSAPVADAAASKDSAISTEAGGTGDADDASGCSGCRLGSRGTRGRGVLENVAPSLLFALTLLGRRLRRRAPAARRGV